MKISSASKLGYDFGIGFWTALFVVIGIMLVLKKLISFFYYKIFPIIPAIKI